MAAQSDGRFATAGAEPAFRIAKLWRMLLALSIGAAGGLIFRWLTLPLPWMLGAMVFNTAAALLRVPIAPPTPMRPYVVVVIGVMLGSGFSREILGQAQVWLLSFSFLIFYLALAGAVAVPFYRRVGGFDLVTAYFAGMPGGLNEMMMIGKDMGGDDRKIVLAHASRILVVVCLFAVWFRFVGGYELGDRSQLGTPFVELAGVDLLVLTACGVVGYWVGHLLRLPAPALVGPMLVSALAHLGGATSLPPPSEAVVVAQLVLGAIIGCRFVGSAARDIGSAILLSLGATMLTLCVTVLFAALFHDLFGQTFEQVLLAYAPGGLAEIGLVALAIDAEVAYVASHHVLRIALVIVFAPAVFALVRRFRRPH